MLFEDINIDYFRFNLVSVAIVKFPLDAKHFRLSFGYGSFLIFLLIIYNKNLM